MNFSTFTISFIIVLLLTGCSPFGENSVLNWQSDLTSTVSGKAEMFTIGGMSVQSSCSSKNVILYSISSDGTVNYSTPARSVPLEVDGSFQFKNLKSVGIDPRTEKINYLLRVEACGEIYSRPLTGLRNQDITASSSLLEKINSANSSGMKKLNQLDSTAIGSLAESISTINSTSVSQAYDIILANSVLKDDIQNLFNLNFEVVKDLTPPDIKSLSVPSTYAESSQASFSVEASHWYNSFLYAYEWTLDNTVVSRRYMRVS